MSGEQPSTAVEPSPEQPTQIIRKSPKALSQRDPMQIAAAFFESGYFPDVKSKAQAVVKIIAGEELGLPPMAAIQGITMIEGKLGFTGNLVATKVKQHPTYDYKVTETSNERCSIDFYDGDEKVGTSEFTIEDAERAGLVKPKSNWEKWPKAMCFNRALTQGVRAYVPDATAGIPAYSDEEIEEVISLEPAPAAEVVEEEPQLNEERVDQLMKGYEIAGPYLRGTTNELDGFNVLLGSLGIDAFSPLKLVREQMATLTEAQADQVDVELQKIGDQLATEEEAANADA